MGRYCIPPSPLLGRVAVVEEQQGGQCGQPKHEWVKPEVRYLAAGAAEVGDGNNPDGFEPS